MWFITMALLSSECDEGHSLAPINILVILSMGEVVNMYRDIESKLRLWSDSAGKAEVFVNSFLSFRGGYPPLKNIAPLGGRDGGRDLQSEDGFLRVACYFPVKEYKPFSEIEAKFKSDMDKAIRGGAGRFVFVTGQMMQSADKDKLRSQSLIPNTDVYDCSDIMSTVSEPRAGFLRAALGFPDIENSFDKEFFENLFRHVSFKKMIYLFHESIDPKIYPHDFFEIFDSLDIFRMTSQSDLLSQGLREGYTAWRDAVDVFRIHLLDNDIFDYVYANHTFVIKKMPREQYELVSLKVHEAFSGVCRCTYQLVRLVEEQLRVPIR